MTSLLYGAVSFSAVATMSLLCVVAIVIGSTVRKEIPRTVSITGPVLLAVTASTAMIVFRLVQDVNLLSDENAWHAQAMLVAQFLSESSTTPPVLSEGKEGYPWIVGTLYSISGNAPLVPITLGTLMFVLLVPLCGAITSLVARDLRMTEVGTSRAIRWACYFVAVCPAVIIWVPRVLRESISMFLIGLMILWFLAYLERRRPLFLVAVGAAAAVMVTIRAQVGLGIIAGLILSAIVVYSTRFRHMFARVLLIGPIFLVIFAVTWAYVDSTSSLSAENIALRNRALSDASSAFEGGDEAYAATSIVDMVLFNLPRAALGPFLTELSGGGGAIIVAAVSNVFWLICILGACLFLPGRRRALGAASDRTEKTRVRAFVVLIVLALTLLAILSITAGNYGLVVRMRLMPLVALIPAAAIGFQVWRFRHRGEELFLMRTVDAESTRPRTVRRSRNASHRSRRS
ncbi:hypothetical protein [Microbacterium aerolatum]|uniref:hypothetical protein n=1 Tax=Microbacterium aerolatum TaxID=153731 RepID=UPI00384C4FAA